jgi:predicted DsbA family dithiol-disulfide isomerase
MLLIKEIQGGTFMKIEVWSDFVCPFCYIGKRRLETALENFPHRGEVEVIYRSFELDPTAKKGAHSDIHALLAAKYGISYEEAKAMNARVGAQAQAVGLTYHFDTMILTNTFDAHRLMHYAARQGKMAEMTERLMKAYFTDSKDIGDHETLAELAEEVGLDKADVLAMLKSGDFADDVRQDEQEAAALGVRGVPFFVLNRKYAVSGAQPLEVFAQALEKAWQEEQPLTLLNDGDADDAVCEDGACRVPTQPAQPAK